MDENNSNYNCSTDNREESETISIVATVASAASLLLCLLAVIAILVLKLHRTLVYRMGIYQVTFAMVFSVIYISFSAYILIVDECFSDGYGYQVLKALHVSSATLNPTITACMMTHLFVFIACHKNVKRLEPLYVVIPLLVMVITAVVILIIGRLEIVHHEYIYVCIGVFVLAGLGILPSIATMVILCYRSCRRKSGTLLDHSKQYKLILRVMLPLLIYPIWSVTYIAILILEYNLAQCDTLCWKITLAFSPTAWSLLAAALLLVHVGLVLCERKRKTRRTCSVLITEEEGFTVHRSTAYQRSYTAASVPIDD